MKNIIHFLKYNNSVVFIVLFVFLLGTGVFAQTETGQELIGQRSTRVEGLDNSLLLRADLDNFDMDFKIEKVESDETYYYVTYTFLDLVKTDKTWKYQMQEKTRKISQKIKKDLGDYLAEELLEQYEARLRELRQAQAKNQELGLETRVELSEYDGLIGQGLEIASRVFSDYEPVRKREIASPLAPELLVMADLASTSDFALEVTSPSDNISEIYEEYINEIDPDADDIFGILDNCPNNYNPRQLDADRDGIGDQCDDEYNPETEPGDNQETQEQASSSQQILDEQENDEIASSSEDLIETASSSTESLPLDTEKDSTFEIQEDEASSTDGLVEIVEITNN